MAGENLRQEILRCFNHHCIPPSSQSLSDTEIHPRNLDKTSCHRAGWQLKVYLKHLPVPCEAEEWNKSPFLCVSAVKSTIPSVNIERLGGTIEHFWPKKVYSVTSFCSAASKAECTPWMRYMGYQPKTCKREIPTLLQEKMPFSLYHCICEVQCQRAWTNPTKMPCDDDCLFLEGFNEKNSFFCM